MTGVFTMSRARFGLLLGLSLVAAVAVAGCGQTSTSTSGPGGTNGPSAHIGAAMATVGGKSEMVLTNDAGMPLYYFDEDSASGSACTAGCMQTWPPLLTTGIPSAAASLTGTASFLDDANGRQATYNGHP